nr:phosphoserine phosphatase SerB [Spelaeicoccus albus]
MSAPAVSDDDVDRAVDVLSGIGVHARTPARLTSSPDAVRIDVPEDADGRAIRAALADLGPDVCVQPQRLRRAGAGLIVLDVDSTFIEQEVVELLAESAGTRDLVADITDRAMRGELDFTQSLRERVGTLAGLPATVLTEVAEQVCPTPGAARLVEGVRDAGAEIALVSGGFMEILEPLAAQFDIRLMLANRLEISGGRLTGRVHGDIVDRRAKMTALRGFAFDLDLDLWQTVAVGDGANDLDMMAVAGLSVAFNAKPEVRRRADTALSFRRLDALLPLAGLVER